MKNKYVPGSIVGPLTIIEYISGGGRGYQKYRVVCNNCGTEGIKWASFIYATASGKLKGCKNCYDLSLRRSDEEPAMKKMYRSYRGNAKSRTIDFTLKYTDFCRIAKENCFYCDAEPTERTGLKEWQAKVALNGIDRANNSLGYTTDNCVACCYDCNRSKSNLDIEDFEKWCKRIAAKSFWTG